MYNKTAIYKFKDHHLEEYKQMTKIAASKYRWKNIQIVREKDRLRKTPFMMEWRILRNIELF